MAQGAQPIDSSRTANRTAAVEPADDTLLLEEALALDAATAPRSDQDDTRAALIETIAFEQFEEDTPRPNPWRDALPAMMCLIAAGAWIGALGWALLSAGAASPANPIEAVGLVALASGPLGLIGIAYLLSRRTSRREARRYAGTAESMRAESARLERTLAVLNQHISATRDELAQQRVTLESLGARTTGDLSKISTAFRAETEALAINAAMLAQAAVSARSDMARLLEDMPRAEALARDVAGLLTMIGEDAGVHARALAESVDKLDMQSRAARTLAEGAASALDERTTALAANSAEAHRVIEGGGAAMRRTIEEALAGAASAIDETRKGLRAQSDAMLAMVEHGSAAIEHAGEQSARAMAERLDSISARIDRFATRLADQDTGSARLVERLEHSLETIEQRLVAIAEDGTARTADLAEAIVTLAGHVDGIAARIVSGAQSADALIAKASTLRSEIAAGQALLEEPVAAALTNALHRARQAAELIEAATLAAQGLLDATEEATRSLGSVDERLVEQRRNIAAVTAGMSEQIGRLTGEIGALDSLVRDTEGSVRELTDGASGQLVEALLRVREAAGQAAERARETLSLVIPTTADRLGNATGDAIERVIDDRMAKALHKVNEVADGAVASAHKATEHLMRQMLTIADTSSQVEARITAAKADLAASEEEGFSRRVALLIESLNSTAIDVTKILSNDVTDSAWAAYLKGDRGVFTRRAVRLIDAGEAREIVRHYETEREFREQVNRYIHDFEGMLRRILATRDGGPLGVTMLSSDMGKLYVALAQAIERLRA